MSLSVHRLAPARFDELATGHGDIGGELRTGQLSKRLLQITAVLSELSVRFPSIYADGQFDRSYQLLATLGRRSRAAVDTILLNPMTGAWAAHALRRLVRDGGVEPLDDDLGHFGAIVAAAALTAGDGFELTLRVRADGTLMVPAFGLARPGLEASWCLARALPGAVDLELDVNRRTVTVPIRQPKDGPGWLPIRRLTSSAGGCRIEVMLDDLDPYRDNHQLGAADRLSATDVSEWQAGLDAAWALLVSRHRRRAMSLSAGITTLIPSSTTRLANLGRAAVVSATVNDACGAMALTRPPDRTAFATTLLHEFQHSKLGALIDLTPLHHTDSETVFYSPWRTDPRPLRGLLHGAYAYLALVDFWQDHRLTAPETERQLAQFEFARWRRAVRYALRTIGGSGLLTENGDRFVTGMRRQLAESLRLPVPREPELLARDTMLDHWMSWRLHNLRPDPDQIATCADAWVAGNPCPPLPPHTVITSGPRLSSANARLSLMHLRLRSPHRFAELCADPTSLTSEVPEATAADTSFVRDDHRAAARLYLAAVAAEPARIDHWAGLALTHRRLGTFAGRVLAARPESVRALYRRIHVTRGTPPDAETLARWMAGAIR